MLDSFTLFIRSLYSGTALRKLYVLRQASQPTVGNRNALSVATVAVLLAALVGFLFHQAWSAHRPGRYLDSHARMLYIPGSTTPWSFTGFLAKTCEGERTCHRYLSNQLTFGQVTQITLATPVKTPADAADDSSLIAMFRAIPDPNIWGTISAGKTLVFALPEMNFRRADVYLDGEHRGTFYDGRRPHISFDPTFFSVRPPQIDVLVESQGKDQSVFAPIEGRPDLGFFVATQRDFESFEEFLTIEKTQQGDAVGWIVRVVLAVFALVLFLAVDSSPESLGLAIFMGFEAFAMSLAFGWLPVRNDTFLANYAFQMGDIFRLYFALQLARMIKKDVAGWLLWGTVLSVPYGLLRHFSPLIGLHWPEAIPNLRDITVGTIGVFVCLRASWFLRNSKLPWRQGALWVGALACFEQVVDPLGSYFPGLASNETFRGIVDIIQPYSAYFFTISTLLNISTLENRVRHLSKAKAKADLMEQDLELGRALQRTFLDIPKLPPEYSIACHHEAARYVSGDSYYVYMSPSSRKITFLVNDVVGHGIQAALKASACQVIAQSIWQKDDQSEGASRVTAQPLLAAYDRYVADYMLKMNKSQDLTAMAGGEFDPKTGQLALYRSNFTFPLVIQPAADLESADEHLGEIWQTQALPLKNKIITNFKLSKGAFVIFLSDGYLTSSRELFHFTRYLRRALANKDAGLTASTLSAIILRYEGFGPQKIHGDDRTLLVFQWNTTKVAAAAKIQRAQFGT